MFKTLAATAALAATIAGVAVVTASPAAAEETVCKVTAKVPNVKVTSRARLVHATLVKDCGAKISIWEIHNASGLSGYLYFEDGDTYSGVVPVLDSVRMGRQTLVGMGAADNVDADVPNLEQENGSFLIKLGSAGTFSATRSGAYVTTAGTVKRYNVSKHAYAPFSGAKVVVQARATTTVPWKQLGSFTTSSTGVVAKHKWTSTQSKNRYFRMVVVETSIVWGTTTAALKR